MNKRKIQKIAAKYSQIFLITREKCTTCENVSRKFVTTKYLMTLYYVGANVSTTSQVLYGSDIAIGYWVLKHKNVSDICCHDLNAEFRRYMYIGSKVIRWEART
jgi:hypothetical protein